jgi:nickel-dependent lactate racemase
VTTRGTPVDIFAEAVDADLRIALGNVEHHYFAGYSEGVKAFLPGISSARAIRNNRPFMARPDARAGKLVVNPVRDDIEELTEHLGVDFILNAVLDEAKVVKAAADHHRDARGKARGILDELFQVGPPAPGADAVLVSAGGFPKDINIHQARKAPDNAAKAVRPGGAVVWGGACDEGFGEAVFERWLNEAGSPADLVSRVKSDFQPGSHKAAAIALVAERFPVFMISNLPKETAKKLFVTPADTLDEAVELALAGRGPGARVWVMPYGGSTLPSIA